MVRFGIDDECWGVGVLSRLPCCFLFGWLAGKRSPSVEGEEE